MKEAFEIIYEHWFLTCLFLFLLSGLAPKIRIGAKTEKKGD